MSNKKHIAKSIVKWLLALLFIFSGMVKLLGVEAEIELFVDHFGIPLWLMYVVGVGEVLGALGLLFGNKINPMLPKVATGGLILIMLGALYFHLTNDPLQMAIPAFVVLILLVVQCHHKKEVPPATPPVENSTSEPM